MVTVLPCRRWLPPRGDWRNTLPIGSERTLTGNPASSSVCRAWSIDRPAHVRYRDERRAGGDDQPDRAAAPGRAAGRVLRDDLARLHLGAGLLADLRLQPGRADRGLRVADGWPVTDGTGPAGGPEERPRSPSGRAAPGRPLPGRTGPPGRRRRSARRLLEPRGQVGRVEPGRRPGPGTAGPAEAPRRTARCRTTKPPCRPRAPPPARPRARPSSRCAGAAARPASRCRRPDRPGARPAATAPAAPPAARTRAARSCRAARRTPVRSARCGPDRPAPSAPRSRARWRPRGRHPPQPEVGAGHRQLGQEHAGVGGPAARLPPGRPQHQLVQRRRDPGHQRGRRRHVVVHVPVGHRQRRVAPVRRGAGEQLEEHDPGRVDVRAGVGDAAGDLLGGDVRDRAEHHAGLRRGARRGRPPGPARSRPP